MVSFNKEHKRMEFYDKHGKRLDDEALYVRVRDIAKMERYPFSETQLWNHMKKRSENGLSSCVRRVGCSVFLRLDLFEKWLDSMCEDTSAPYRERTYLGEKGLALKTKDSVSEKAEQYDMLEQ